MAQTIKLRRSATGGNVPDNNDLALGEVAINTNDGLMFLKKDVSGTESICTFHPTTAASNVRTLTLDRGSGNTTFTINFPDNSGTLANTYIDGNAGRIATTAGGMTLEGYGNLGLYTNGAATLGGGSASQVIIGGTSCNTVTIQTTNTGKVVLPSKIEFSTNGRTPTRTDSPVFEMKLEDNNLDSSDITFSEGVRLSSYAFGVMQRNDTSMENATDGYAYTAISLHGGTDLRGLLDIYYARTNTSYFLRPSVTGNQTSLKQVGHAEFGKTNTVNYPEVKPMLNYRGYLGTSTKRWYYLYNYFGNMYGLTITGYISMGDSDQVRFGASQDAKLFYDGVNNDFELELESACTQFKITDNATTRFTFTKSSGDFTATGNVTAYSDERLKSDIKTLDPSKTLEMRGVEFIKDGKKGSGVIAQELEKVAPELVVNEGEYKSVAYGNLSGYLIETIKDQQKQIDELKELVHKLLEK